MRRAWRVAGCATMLLAGCLSQPLSKQDAGTLIRTSSAFTRPKFAHIPRQLTFQGYFQSSYGTEGILSINDVARVDPTVAILKLQRVVNVSESIYGPGRDAMHLLVVDPVGLNRDSLFADESARTGGYDPQEEQDAQEERVQIGYASWTHFRKEIGWRVPIGDREFVQVDQIHNWKDANENIPVNELAVDFSWRWKPNEFGAVFDSRSEAFQSYPTEVQDAAKNWGLRMNTEVTMHSRAYLQRVGNQWQLRVIQWSFGRGNPR